MYDRTREHASTSTDRDVRRRPLSLRGLLATALLAAAVPAVAWAVSHPAAAALAVLAAGAAGATIRVVRGRLSVDPDRPREAADAALAALGRGESE